MRSERKILKNTKSSAGYLCVGLHSKGKNKWSLVHRLVAQSFIELQPGRKHVNHIDSNKENNCIENLEWCTPKENLVHARRYGGLKNILKKAFVNNAKLSDRQVSEAIELKRKSGLSNQSIACKYGVSRRSMDRIINGESYTWVKRLTGTD